MVFVVQRKSQVEEILELRDEQGNLAHSLSVKLDVEKIAPALYKARKELIEAQNKANAAEAYEDIGAKEMAFFKIVFGEENANLICEFYDGKYTEMLLDITPFITEVIYPKINQISNQKMEQLKAARRKMKK